MTIYSFSDPIFSGHISEEEQIPALWNSTLPTLNLFQGAALVDTALLRKDYGEFDAGSSAYNAGDKSVAFGLLNDLAAINLATSLRGLVGQIAVTVGFVREFQPSVSKMYQDTLGDVVRGLDIVTQVISNQHFKEAMKGIQFIPSVGWVLKMTLGALKVLLKVRDRILKEKIKAATRQMGEIAAKYGVPVLASWDQEWDQLVNREVLGMISKYQATRVFAPRFPVQNVDDFVAKMAGYDRGDVELADFWYLVSNQAGGAGFIPGTTTLLNAISFRTRACGSIQNAGDALPSPRQTAQQFWQIVLQDSGAMFSVNTAPLMEEWESFVGNLLAYGQESVMKGWTCSLSSKPWSSKELCGKWNLGDGNCKKKSQYGDWVTIKGDGHGPAFLTWIIKQFWGRGSNNNTFPYPVRDHAKDSKWPDNFYFENMVPTHALKNLRDRQNTVLDSMTCMYVNDERVGGSYRFPAIGENSVMKKRWRQNVQALFTSGDWKKAYMPDVPEGTVKKELRDRGMPDKPGMVPFGIGLTAKTVLGDAKPPAPPEESGAGNTGITGSLSAPGAKDKGTSRLLLAAGATAGAVYAYSKWGK